MNYRMLAHLLGVILLIEAALLLLPALTALLYGESVIPFLVTMALLLIAALPNVIVRPKNRRIYAKEGFVCVVSAWILMSLFGALPFVISGAIPNYVDAVFETVSGFTTTGATILTEIESLPRGILFWRSFTHWIGGMGVLVFVLAILPSDDGRAIHLMRAEVPGPTKGKLVPKLRETAQILYMIYLSLTVLETVLLLIAGIPFYDALVSTFATVGTGGFSVLNASIAGYHNAAAEWIIAVFMLLCGINFNLYFFLLMRRFRDVLKSEELRVYLLICAVSTAIIAVNTAHMFQGVEECLRTSFFQVTSIMSTTGFTTVNYDTWPELSKTLLVILTVIGACAGSTAGGLKISRIILIFKSIVREIKHMLRPKSVNVVRLDGEVVSEETVKASTNYLSLYIMLIILSTLLISVDNFDFTTNLTSVLTCINNVGPGLNAVGPVGNFAGFSYFSKLILSALMLFGRLEIMPVVILFSVGTWKKK